MKANPKRSTLADAHTRLRSVRQILKDAQSLLREMQRFHRQLMMLSDEQVREAMRALKRPIIDITIKERKRNAR